MSKLDSYVNKINSGIDRIINHNKELKDNLSQTQSNLDQLKSELDKTTSELSNLREKYRLLKLAKSLNRKEEKTSDVKLKINELVKEIDKCMGMLNA